MATVMPGQSFGSNLLAIPPCCFLSSTAVACHMQGFHHCSTELYFWQPSKHAMAPKALSQGLIRPRASSRGKPARRRVLSAAPSAASLCPFALETPVPGQCNASAGMPANLNNCSCPINPQVVPLEQYLAATDDKIKAKGRA